MLRSASKRKWQSRISVMPVVLFVLISNAVSSGHAAETQPAPVAVQPWQVYKEWPFNAAEAKRRQQETANALNSPVEKTIDLGNGVTLELVLIPAGRFIMGTPEPLEPDWVALADDIIRAQIFLVLAASTVLAFVLLVLFRAWRLKRRPQMSLRFLLALILVLSFCSWGGVGWHQGTEAQTTARSLYDAALSRFRGAESDEKPAHAVTLSKPFYIGKYEVTQLQYVQVMGNNLSQIKGSSLPVETVSWDKAVSFCRKVDDGAGLPSEAEWEYACRAGTMTTYCSGDSGADLARVGWHSANSGWRSHPVGKKESNSFGLYDMHGNVFEWCQDRYESYTSDPLMAPQEPGSGTGRLLRGGSWDNVARFCRSARRNFINPLSRYYYCGFRVLVSAPRTP